MAMVFLKWIQNGKCLGGRLAVAAGLLIALSATLGAAADDSIIKEGLAASAAAATTPASEASLQRQYDSMAERVLACTTCHGPEGRATPYGYFPRIAGKPAGYLYNQLLNFREGRRTYPSMTYLLDHLSDAYLQEMAEHFASLQLPYPPSAQGQFSAAVLAQGERLVRLGVPERGVPACIQCHGAHLMGVGPAIPGLLGLPRDYLNAQFGAWRNGKRQAHAPDCMKQVAERLDFDEIHAVNVWLSAQPVPEDASTELSHTALILPLPCGGVGVEEDQHQQPARYASSITDADEDTNSDRDSAQQTQNLSANRKDDGQPSIAIAAEEGL